MRDIKRIDKLLTLINQLWKENPDLRFFQLLQFVGVDCDHTYMEDEILTNMIQNKIDSLPITREQQYLIHDIKMAMDINFNGVTRGEASKFIADNIDEYMLRRYDSTMGV